MKEHITGIYWIIGFTIADAFGLNLGRAMGDAVHIYQFLFIGNGLAAIILFFLARKMEPTLTAKKPKLHLFRAFVEVFGQGLMFYALMKLPVAEVKSILFLIPIMATIVAVFFLGEKSSFAKWAALLVGFAGVLIILQPDKDIIHPASFIALGAAFLLCIGLTIIKIASKHDSPIIISLYFTGLMSLMCMPMGIYYWQPIPEETYKFLIMFGFVIAAAHITIASACKHTPLVVLTPFFFVGLIFVALVAYIAWGEVPQVATFIGGAVILAAATYVTYLESKGKK